MLSLLGELDSTRHLPLGLQTAAASAAAGCWRMLLMPLDTAKAMMQVQRGWRCAGCSRRARGAPSRTHTQAQPWHWPTPTAHAGIDPHARAAQVEGQHGLQHLWRKARAGGPGVLYHGAAAAFVASFAGHFPWFTTVRGAGCPATGCASRRKASCNACMPRTGVGTHVCVCVCVHVSACAPWQLA
jgi:hypothetical protein